MTQPSGSVSRNSEGTPQVDDFEAQFEKFDLFSVDVFDTLVYRLARTPQDIFRFIGNDPEVSNIAPDFFKERIFAEQTMREDTCRGAIEDITLAQIYARLQVLLRCSDAQRDLLMRKEIDMEIAAIFPTVFSRSFLERMRANNKRFVLTTDMYLPRDAIEKILEKCHIGGWEKLILSSQTLKTKFAGGAYDLVTSHFGSDPAQILHVGDNAYVDGERAREHGLSVCLVRGAKDLADRRSDKNTSIFSAQSQLAQAARAHCLQHYWAAQSNLGSVLRKGQLDAARMSRTQYLYSLGATVLAPAMLAFALWLARAAREENITHLAFLARDGKFLKEVFDLVVPGAFSTSYLAASRRATVLPFVELTGENIAEYFAPTLKHSTTIENFAKTVGLGASFETSVRQLGFDPEVKLTRKSKKAFFEKLRLDPQIIGRSLSHEQADVSAYYAAQLAEDAHCGIVDLGWRGSLQSGIAAAHPHKPKLHGFYFGTTFAAHALLERAGQSHDAFACRLDVPRRNAIPLQSLIHVLEFFCAADHGSVQTIKKRPDGTFDVLYMKLEKAESDAQAAARQIQNGASDTIKSLLATHNASQLNKLAETYDLADLWRALCAPKSADAAQLADIRAFDGIGDTHGSPLSRAGQFFRMERQIRKSKWKQAYLASVPGILRPVLRLGKGGRRLLSQDNY